MATATTDGSTQKRIRLFGAALCLGYGLLLLGLGIYTMHFDHHKSRLVWTSFMLLFPAITILLAGAGAILKKTKWPLAALLGSFSILAIAGKMSQGRPLSLFSIAPLGVVALVIPALIITVSVAALIMKTGNNYDA